MKERPIIFSAPMVRAILSGAKTQTRRVVKVRCHSICEGDDGKLWPWSEDAELAEDFWHPCPFGEPGDHLWVRETWMPDAPRDGTWAATAFYGCGMSPLGCIPERFRKPEHCLYRATWNDHDIEGWKPSIHMPRWASRITLEITDVRVERLQDISEADAIAEGAIEWARGACAAGNPTGLTAVGYFRLLWESINGPGSWDANPLVWVIGLKKLESGDVR